jgi:hypothetical protein
MFRDNDPVTSRIAAEDLDLPVRQQQTMVVLLLAPGSTHSELAQLVCDAFPYLGKDGWEHPHKRLPELQRKGLAYPGEPRPCRVTGKLARVWFPVTGVNNLEKTGMLEDKIEKQTEAIMRIADALELIAKRVGEPQKVEVEVEAHAVEAKPEEKPAPKAEAKPEEKPAPKRRRRKKKAEGPTFADVKALVREMNTSVPSAEVQDLMEAWEIESLNELEEADYPEFLGQVRDAIDEFAAA